MSIESESWRLFHEHRSEIIRLRAENTELRSENAALRSIAAAMAEEMELHGGEQAFDSLAWYRAALEKEDKP